MSKYDNSEYRVPARAIESELAEAKRLLAAFCKATNPPDSYGWVVDEMRRMTSREREAVRKFLSRRDANK